jgi:hypothetical protein
VEKLALGNGADTHQQVAKLPNLMCLKAAKVQLVNLGMYVKRPEAIKNETFTDTREND